VGEQESQSPSKYGNENRYPEVNAKAQLAIYRREPLLHLLEALVELSLHLLEALVELSLHLLEALVELSLHLLEALVDLVKAIVHPTLKLGQMVIEVRFLVSEPIIEGGAKLLNLIAQKDPRHVNGCTGSGSMWQFRLIAHRNSPFTDVEHVIFSNIPRTTRVGFSDTHGLAYPMSVLITVCQGDEYAFAILTDKNRVRIRNRTTKVDIIGDGPNDHP
jgi:hypothetical protein